MGGDRLVETLSKSETMEAIKALQSDKSLGPDWFPVELYGVSVILSLLLINMFNILRLTSFKIHSLPLFLLQSLYYLRRVRTI